MSIDRPIPFHRSRVRVLHCRDELQVSYQRDMANLSVYLPVCPFTRLSVAPRYYVEMTRIAVTYGILYSQCTVAKAESTTGSSSTEMLNTGCEIDF